MRIATALLAGALAAAGALVPAPPAHAAGKIDCQMRFSMSGWSVLYKTANGTGTIRCNNGQSLQVKLRVKGGGLTVGKSTIDNGLAKFSEVRRIDDLLGGYAAGEAHAGAVKSSAAQVMTKGEVSMALSGVGHGWDLGVALSEFRIERRR